MKSLSRRVGITIFWLLWPSWYVYFKLQPTRSRVLVIAEDEVLLVRSWISDGSLGLPGGGKNQKESVEQSAVRELYEETGIEVPESALTLLGKRRFIKNKIPYRAVCFVLTLDSKPHISMHPLEILETQWVSLEEAAQSTDPDTRYALKRYMPTTQEILL